MKKLILLMGILLIIFICGCGGTKYDPITKSEKLVSEVNTYHQNLMNSDMPIIAEYLKTVVGSPDYIINKLKAGGADDQVLSFATKNKQFIYKLVHSVIIQTISASTEQELIMVTNYIKSPTAIAATTQQELEMEYAVMRNYRSYSLWEQNLKNDSDFSNFVKMMLDSYLKIVTEKSK